MLETLKQKLEALEKEEFYHQMKDHWDSYDFSYDCRLKQQIKEVRAKIAEIEKVGV